MANLGAISNLRDSQRGRASLAKILMVSPFLRFLDSTSAWEEKPTSFFYRTKEGSLALARRDVNGSYTSVNLAPAGKQTGGLRYAGFQIDIDQTHLADDARGLEDLGGWIERELPEEVDSFARNYEAEMFNGSGAGTPVQMTGLKTLLSGTNPPGFSTSMVLNAKDAASGNHLDLTVRTNDDAFIEWLLLQLALVEDVKGIVMSPRTHARIGTIARSKHMHSIIVGDFGKPVELFNGIPMVKTLDTSILHTEPDDAGTPANVTSSLYIMSPGEGRVSVGSNSGLDFEDYDKLESKQAGRIKGEIRSEWAIQKKNVIRRVRNVRV